MISQTSSFIPGTLLVVFNLKLLLSGEPELDVKTDKEDILVAGALEEWVMHMSWQNDLIEQLVLSLRPLDPYMVTIRFTLHQASLPIPNLGFK